MSESFTGFYFSDYLVDDFSFSLSFFLVAFLDQDWKLWLKVLLATLAAAGIFITQFVVLGVSLLSCFVVERFLELLNLDSIRELALELTETITLTITGIVSVIILATLWNIAKSPLEDEFNIDSWYSFRAFFIGASYLLVVPAVKGVLFIGAFFVGAFFRFLH